MNLSTGAVTKQSTHRVFHSALRGGGSSSGYSSHSSSSCSSSGNTNYAAPNQKRESQQISRPSAEAEAARKPSQTRPDKRPSQE